MGVIFMHALGGKKYGRIYGEVIVLNTLVYISS
jgi:hypothetical protein